MEQNRKELPANIEGAEESNLYYLMARLFKFTPEETDKIPLSIIQDMLIFRKLDEKSGEIPEE